MHQVKKMNFISYASSIENAFYILHQAKKMDFIWSAPSKKNEPSKKWTLYHVRQAKISYAPSNENDHYIMCIK